VVDREFNFCLGSHGFTAGFFASAAAHRLHTFSWPFFASRHSRQLQRPSCPQMRHTGIGCTTSITRAGSDFIRGK
jgi:hypothetical protein